LPGNCGNSIFVFRREGEATNFTAQEYWKCGDFGKRKVATNKTGLSPSDALIVDGHRGKIIIAEELTGLVWGVSPKRILSLKIKNTGPVSIRIDSVEVLHESLHGATAWPKIVDLPFVLFPDSEVIVPAVDMNVLTSNVFGSHPDENTQYSVITKSSSECNLPEGSFGNCELLSRGFGLSIKFTDVFGDRYQLNKLEYLLSKKTIITGSMPLREAD
jgi:hypothetical protein